MVATICTLFPSCDLRYEGGKFVECPNWVSKADSQFLGVSRRRGPEFPKASDRGIEDLELYSENNFIETSAQVFFEMLLLMS